MEVELDDLPSSQLAVYDGKWIRIVDMCVGWCSGRALGNDMGVGWLVRQTLYSTQWHGCLFEDQFLIDIADYDQTIMYKYLQ